MCTPLVSVVLASYNHESFILEAMNSVLGQSLENLELIVVDDASTDQTAELARSIKDPRVRVFCNAANRGRHPRNMGLWLARGSYIALQNSDDVWLPEKLAVQLQAMQTNAELVACFSGVQLIDEGGQLLDAGPFPAPFRFFNGSREAWLQAFFFGNFVALPTALVRRDAMRAVGGFTRSLFQLSDMDLWMRLASRGDLIMLEQATVRCRILADKRNLSADRPNTRRRNAWEFGRMLNHYVRPPLLAQMPAIFGDRANAAMRHDNPLQRKSGFARLCAETATIAHCFFALHLLEEVVEDYAFDTDFSESERSAIIHLLIDLRDRVELKLLDSDHPT